jgi:cell division protein FtsB
MAEIVNLNRVRKAKARDVAEAQAAENRAKYGQTKAERARLAAEAAKLRAVTDGAKKED